MPAACCWARGLVLLENRGALSRPSGNPLHAALVLVSARLTTQRACTPCALAQLSRPNLLCTSVWRTSGPDQQPPPPQQVQDVLKQTSKQLGTDLSISGFVRVQVRLAACCSMQLVLAACWAVPAAPISCGASFACSLGCRPLAHLSRCPPLPIASSHRAGWRGPGSRDQGLCGRGGRAGWAVASHWCQ